MPIQCAANDYFALSSRKITDAGHLVAPGQIARTGIQTYRRFELGLDGNPTAIVRLYRPPEEVFAPDSMRSFEGVPVTVNHPADPRGVHDGNRAELGKGSASEITRVGDFMTAVLTVTSADAIQAIQDGKSQLSNGYVFDLDMTPGTAPDGQPYHGVQRNIRGNHVAAVDAARCGSACRIADSTPTTIGDSAMTTQKITVDGIPLEVSDIAAAAIGKLVAQVGTLTAALKTANDSMVGMVPADAHAKVVTELETTRKDVMTPAARDAMVADWAGLLAEAKRLVPALVTDGKTCHAIRKEVLAGLIASDATAKAIAGAVLGAAGVDGATEDGARAAFGAVAASIKTAAADGAGATDQQLAAALAGAGGAVVVSDAKAVLVGRDKFLHQSAQAWQAKQ